MKLVAALLVCGACGCAPLPSVALRVRARMQHTERRTARTFEARIDCGWSLERGAAPVETAPIEPASATQPRDWSLAAAPCAVPRACVWEAAARDQAQLTRGGEAP